MQDKITVIVIAHDRKQYLKEAIQSLQFQSLDPKYFEVVIVKNFELEETDELAKRLGFKLVFTEAKSAYEKLLIGFRNSNGAIITFLEDDDKYCKERLKEIYTFFTTHENVCYYHNDHLVISSESHVVLLNNNKRRLENRFIFARREPDSSVSLREIIKLKKMRVDFNVSSIAVRRSLLNDAILRYGTSMFGGDHYLFLAALGSGCDIALDREPLTLYRVHTSNFSNPLYLEGKIHDFISQRLELIEYLLSRIELERAVFKDFLNKPMSSYSYYADLESLMLRTNYYILSSKVTRGKMFENLSLLIKFLKLYDIRFLLEFLILTAISFISKQVSRYIYIALFMKVRPKV